MLRGNVQECGDSVELAGLYSWRVGWSRDDYNDEDADQRPC